MNGTTTAAPRRSVQLAVMAAPSASVAEAVAEARRRHETAGDATARQVQELSFRPQPAG